MEPINVIYISNKVQRGGLPDNIRVIDWRDIIWSTNRSECREQFSTLSNESLSLGARILLEHVPPMLAIVIADFTHVLVPYSWIMPGVGVVITTPAEPVQQVYTGLSDETATELCHAAKFANKDADIWLTRDDNLLYDMNTVTVTVMPPEVFSHIEWL